MIETTQILGSRLSPQSHAASQFSSRWWLAKGISILFSPPILGVLGLMLLGLQLNSSQNWAWLAVYAGLTIIAPVVYVLLLMQTGAVSNFHMSNRLERAKPLKAVLLFFLLSMLVFLATKAPTLFVVFAVAGTLQSAAMFLITLRWKISGHGAGAAGFSVLLWGLYGIAAAPVFLFVPLVIWARLNLQRHDLLLSLAGAVLGAATMFLAVNLIAAGCPGADALCA